MQAVGPLAKSPFVSPCEPGLSCWPPTSRISRSPHSSVSRGSWWPAGARAFSKAASAGIAKDAPRPGRTPAVSKQKVQQIIHKTTREKRPTPPTGAAAPWPPRPASAPWDGFGAPMASRPRQDLQAQLVSPRNSDIVGLYLNPPEHALVLSPSQIQAHDRTQPGLPLKKGRVDDDPRLQAATARPPCLRRSTLFGSVIAECMPRHSHQEWLRFLRLIDRRTPKDKQLHLIDN